MMMSESKACLYQWRNSAFAASVLSLATLVGCQTPLGGLQGAESGGQLPVPTDGQTVTANPTGTAQGEVVGTGPIRVAMLVPTSGSGNAGKVAVELKNAAKMAVSDIGANRIQLVIKDTKGQSGLSQDLASQAIKEGSSLILGPLLSANVTSAAGIARPANVPMVAFSTDTNIASSGVYLNSFPPQLDTRRTLAYAASKGKRNIVAVLPQGAYGIAIEAEMRRTSAATGGKVLGIAKYNPKGDAASIATSIKAAVATVAAPAKNADTLFIPYFAGTASQIVSAFNAGGVSTNGKQILGSSLWFGDRSNAANLRGAWFAERNENEFNAFSARYKSQFGTDPSFNAGLAYDAVSLAIGLHAQFGQQAYAQANLQNLNGFSGVTGLFRFNSQGRPERGLAMYQYTGAKPTIIQPAPTTFGQGG